MATVTGSALRVQWRPAFLVASALVVLFTIQNWIAPPARLATATWLEHFLVQAATWYTWLPLLPLIIGAVPRARREGRLRPAALPGQLVIAAVVTLLHGALTGFMRWVLGVSTSPDLLVAVTNFPIYDFASGFTRYCLIAAFYHLAAYHDEARARELRAAQLEASLARARLENLQSVLQPHFLFNTLNSIAELVRDDPGAAERMVESLAELLRASLAHGSAIEITLDEELALLEKYTAIERVRFQDRLRVELDVAPAAGRVRVPQLLLQPLVENAIRHGLARREGAGFIRISAQRVNGGLRIQIMDDGPGPGGEAVRSGIGLGTTRIRLQQLYGSHQRLDIAAVQPHGTVVTIDLPWRDDLA